MKKKVILGMSGGVDSSVAAHVLKEKGYEVIGVTLKLMPDDIEKSCPESKIHRICCSAEAINEARVTALRADVPHYVIEGVELFKNQVIKKFIDEYMASKTPNPCTTCNALIKMPMLQEVANNLGADFIATGHYIKRVERDGMVEIVRGDDDRKEQSYMLSLLSNEQIKKLLLPMGEMSKTETREIANKLEIINANKPDSQDICFIPDNDYRKFLKENATTKIKSGNIIDLNGKILGRHDGQINYTIGQRKGLGINLKYPIYVVGLDSMGNVIVGRDEDIYKETMIVKSVVYQHKEFEVPGEYLVQVRYHHDPILGQVEKYGKNMLKITFCEKVRAITPGQIAAFYKDRTLLGGGIIMR
jgi:tRNA-specific 2-thiouridylase